MSAGLTAIGASLVRSLLWLAIQYLINVLQELVFALEFYADPADHHMEAVS